MKEFTHFICFLQITVVNAARRYLGTDNLAGKVCQPHRVVRNISCGVWSYHQDIPSDNGLGRHIISVIRLDYFNTNLIN